MINWSAITEEENETIYWIVSRAYNVFALSKFKLTMDITACHITNPLRLAELSGASDGDFAHDILGIRENINRDTGKLENCFLPRYSK